MYAYIEATGKESGDTAVLESSPILTGINHIMDKFSKTMKITTKILLILIISIILTAHILLFHYIFHKNGRYRDKNLCGHV
jgi:hypothetical protein